MGNKHFVTQFQFVTLYRFSEGYVFTAQELPTLRTVVFGCQKAPERSNNSIYKTNKYQFDVLFML